MGTVVDVVVLISPTGINGDDMARGATACTTGKVYATVGDAIVGGSPTGIMGVVAGGESCTMGKEYDVMGEDDGVGVSCRMVCIWSGWETGSRCGMGGMRSSDSTTGVLPTGIMCRMVGVSVWTMGKEYVVVVSMTRWGRFWMRRRNVEGRMVFFFLVMGTVPSWNRRMYTGVDSFRDNRYIYFFFKKKFKS